MRSRTGSKSFLALEPGYRESIESWTSVLRGLEQRDMNCPRMATGDGNLGFWGALASACFSKLY
ncbi:hypothetical protein ACFLWC_04185 [Chloroflexota bacterium]